MGRRVTPLGRYTNRHAGAEIAIYPDRRVATDRVGEVGGEGERGSRDSFRAGQQGCGRDSFLVWAQSGRQDGPEGLAGAMLGREDDSFPEGAGGSEAGIRRLRTSSMALCKQRWRWCRLTTWQTTAAAPPGCK